MVFSQQLDMFSADQPAFSYGWLGTVADFRQLPTEVWLQSMTSQYQSLYQQRPTQTQIQAWQDTQVVLSQALGQSHQHSILLIFEYELPREGVRCPDVVLLAGE